MRGKQMTRFAKVIGVGAVALGIMAGSVSSTAAFTTNRFDDGGFGGGGGVAGAGVRVRVVDTNVEELAPERPVDESGRYRSGNSPY